MPRKTCKFRLSRNSTKFYVLARFRETIPTVKSVFVIRDLENKFRIFNRNYNFITEITILPFFQKLEFLGSYIINIKFLFMVITMNKKLLLFKTIKNIFISYIIFYGNDFFILFHVTINKFYIFITIKNLEYFILFIIYG